MVCRKFCCKAELVTFTGFCRRTKSCDTAPFQMGRLSDGSMEKSKIEYYYTKYPTDLQQYISNSADFTVSILGQYKGMEIKNVLLKSILLKNLKKPIGKQTNVRYGDDIANLGTWYGTQCSGIQNSGSV
ncbi:MAG: hypothetical protein LUG99_12530 [Lachnospiraceae bacterium]|nr:hypothetical protein [Lachnospiraceae bacterium]